MRMLDDLCREGETRILDFGVGDAEYKRRYADRHVEEEDVVVYASTLRAMRINLVRTALVGTTDVVARGIQRLGLYDRLKRSWRKRLQSGDSAR